MSRAKRARVQSNDDRPGPVDFDSILDSVSRHLIPDIARIVTGYMGCEPGDQARRLEWIKRIWETGWDSQVDFVSFLHRQLQEEKAALPKLLVIVRERGWRGHRTVCEYCCISQEMATFLGGNRTAFLPPQSDSASFDVAVLDEYEFTEMNPRREGEDVTDLVRGLPIPEQFEWPGVRFLHHIPARDYLQWKGAASVIVKVWKRWLERGSPDMADITDGVEAIYDD